MSAQSLTQSSSHRGESGAGVVLDVVLVGRRRAGQAQTKAARGRQGSARECKTRAQRGGSVRSSIDRKETGTREDVEFHAEDGVTLRGLFTAPDTGGPHPIALPQLLLSQRRMARRIPHRIRSVGAADLTPPEDLRGAMAVDGVHEVLDDGDRDWVAVALPGGAAHSSVPS